MIGCGAHYVSDEFQMGSYTRTDRLEGDACALPELPNPRPRRCLEQSCCHRGVSQPVRKESNRGIQGEAHQRGACDLIKLFFF